MAVGPKVSTLTVTTAGTRARANAGTSQFCVSIYFEALKTNAGVIYIGDSSVSSTLYAAALTAGSGFGVSFNNYGRTGSTGAGLQLNAWYADASNSGDKVQVTYIERLGPL